MPTFCMDYYYLCQKLRFYYERSRYIVKGWDFMVNGQDVSWQVKIYYERSRFYYERSRISCWQVKMPGRDFHNDWLGCSWWQVDIFMTGQDFVMKGQDFHDDRSKFCYEWSTFWCWCIIGSSKLRSARGWCSHMSWAYPCHWAEGCCSFLSVFGKNGFNVKTNQGIVWSEGLLVVTWWWVLIRKNNSLGGLRDPRFIFFLVGPLDVL